MSSHINATEIQVGQILKFRSENYIKGKKVKSSLNEYVVTNINSVASFNGWNKVSCGCIDVIMELYLANNDTFDPEDIRITHQNITTTQALITFQVDSGSERFIYIKSINPEVTFDAEQV